MKMTGNYKNQFVGTFLKQGLKNLKKSFFSNIESKSVKGGA